MTCSHDGSLRIWHLESGTQIGDDWRDGESAVATIALSPDGKNVASGSGDGTVRLWDIETSTVIAKWTGHARSVKLLSWNRDGQRVVSGSFDGTARVWDVKGGEVMVGPLRAGYDVDAVIYSPDNTGAVTFPEKDHIKIWDQKTGKLVTNLRGHRYTVTCLAWSADGRMLFSGSLDNSTKMWNTTTWQQIAIFDHISSVLAIAISPNGYFLASASFDGKARLWNIEDAQSIGPPFQHAKSVSCLSFSDDGNLLTTGCFDNSVYLWDISQMSREPHDIDGLDELTDDSDNTLREVGIARHIGQQLENDHCVPSGSSDHSHHQFYSRLSRQWRLPRHRDVRPAFLSYISSLFRSRVLKLRPTPINQAEEIPVPTTSEAEARLCSVCSALDLYVILLDGVPMERALPLGHLADILNKQDECGLCRLIANIIRRGWNLYKLSDINIAGITCALYAEHIAALDENEPTSAHPTRSDRYHRLRVRTSSTPPEAIAAIVTAQSSFLLEIQLLEEDAYKVGRTREFHGRRVDQNIDIDLLKRWIYVCETEHREKCETLWWKDPADVLPKFIRVLDTIHMAIVRAPRSCHYVALSYVWGSTGDDYRTTQENLKQRSRRNDLDISMLPPMIRDTIQLVRQLGERYLWVDALCIVQNDLKDKEDQIGAMELVYALSKFTIFAAGGNSVYDPLPGLHPGTRFLRQEIAKIQGLHFAIPLIRPREAIASSEWNTRGWTYQELMLSRRRIFFTSHFMHFECVRDVFSEDTVTKVNSPWALHPLLLSGAGQFIQSGALLRNQNLMQQQRGMELSHSGYMTMVEEYTRRKLTFESDIANAIMALMNAMAKGYQWGGGDPEKAFRFAMPLGDLESALLWQPAANAPHERRVQVADKNKIPWPSWSWIAWRGAVLYGSGYGSFAGDAPSYPPLIRESLVEQWHIVGDDGKLTQQDVRRTRRMGDGAHWATYILPKGKIDPQQLISASMLLLPGTLLFRTSSACFEVEKAVDLTCDETGTNYAIYSILSDIPQLSTRVGRILLPCSTRSPTSCEFVVLSRTSGHAGWFDEHRLDENKNLARLGYSGCMFYVMAVQKMQDEDRLERLGVGVILDRAWVNSTTTAKNYILGIEIETIGSGPKFKSYVICRV